MLKDELCLSYEALLFLYHSDDYEISKVSQMNAQIRKWNEVSSFSLKWGASSRIENPDGHIVQIPHEGVWRRRPSRRRTQLYVYIL